MRTPGVVGALLAVAAVVFGSAPVAWADPGEAVTAFDAVATVDGAGDLQVIETIGYRFAGTAHHGLLRELHSSRVTAVRVETPTGAPASTSVTVSGGYTTLRVGDPARTVSGTQTYVLHYAVGGVVGGDVLRWDFVGDGWQVPVQRATVRVTAPRPAQTRQCAAVGCTVTASGATAVFAAGPLAPGNGLPVTLDYPAGTVGGTSPWQAILGWLQLAVVLGVLGGLGWVVARVLRSPPTDRAGAHRAVAAVPLVAAGLPAPPPDVSPGLLAVLDGRGKGTDAVTATLLDLAVRGYFRVEEQAGRRPRGWTLVATAPTTPDRTAPHEEALLHSAFGGRPATTITTVCTGRTRTLDAAHRALVAEAVARGWVAKNLMATSGKAVGMAIFFVGFLAALANFAGFPRSFPLFFLCFGVSFVGVLVSALSAHARPVRRTRAGDAVLAELAPYRAALAGTGLERIPPDRAAEVFSRSLPYAVALGMASAWTRRFADLFALAPQGAPSWYRPAGKGTTALGAVTADVAGFVTAAGVRPAASSSGSSWSSGSFGSSGSSSSDSSFSGGGDSGGGSSGGGGSW